MHLIDYFALYTASICVNGTIYKVSMLHYIYYHDDKVVNRNGFFLMFVF